MERKLTNAIDVHNHMIPDFYLAALADAGVTTSGSIPYPEWSPQIALDVMDRAGIQTAMTSVSSPGIDFGISEARAREVTRRCNDYSAELITQHPSRFGSFGVLPLPFAELAAGEVVRGLDELKLDGFIAMASQADNFLGDPCYEEVYQELDRRAAVVFIHPTVHKSLKHISQSLPAFLMEFTFDTTRAALNLIAQGVTRKYPNIRFILSHAGGTLPYLAWRLTQGIHIDPRLEGVLPADVSAAVKHFWYDTALSAGEGSLACLLQVADQDKILFGSDWPYAPEAVTRNSVDALLSSKVLEPELLAALQRKNPERLFPRLAG